ncbi:MAG: hypothetical protein AAFO89_09415, partial [Planctomycetota bacterium]
GRGADGTLPNDINASDQFTGIELAGNSIKSFLYTVDGGATSIFPIGCDDLTTSSSCFFVESDPTVSEALNDNAVVVGSSVVLVDDGTGLLTPERVSGFIWSHATGTLDLLDLVVDGSASGWELTQGDQFTPGPTDINNDGVIVGNGINPMGEPAAYVLLPRSPCAADVNRDGNVNPNDFNAWILAFNNGCD